MAAESTASETLTVHLNRGDIHAIEAPASFASSDSFIIELDNHGEASHVHLRLDEALSGVASLPASNHYVRPGAVARVPVSVDDTGPVGGILTVATAYGSESEGIEVTVEPTAGRERVEIDESLVERSGGVESGPRGPPTATAATATAATAATGVDRTTLLGGTALVVVLGIALLFVEGIALYVGALAVLGGVLVAAYLLLYS